MTENEYVETTNLAKVGVAYAALVSVLANDDTSVIPQLEHQRVLRQLNEWMISLHQIIGITKG